MCDAVYIVLNSVEPGAAARVKCVLCVADMGLEEGRSSGRRGVWCEVGSYVVDFYGD